MGAGAREDRRAGGTGVRALRRERTGCHGCEDGANRGCGQEGKNGGHGARTEQTGERLLRRERTGGSRHGVEAKEREADS